MEPTTETLNQRAETNECLRLSRDKLMEEMKLHSQRFTQQAGIIISLETRNAALQKELSSQILRNAVLSSENDELKQQIALHVAAQKNLARDVKKSRKTRWYLRFLAR